MRRDLRDWNKLTQAHDENAVVDLDFEHWELSRE
jgi:hypothetical protein